MTPQLRFFLLVSEYVMLGNQIHYLFKQNEQEEKRNRIIENQKVIRNEIQRIVDSALQTALEREPEGIETIYKELNIERI